MRSISCTQYSHSQEIFDRFEARKHGKCYTVERFPEVLRKLDIINEGGFVLTWLSDSSSRGEIDVVLHAK
jgi:hypothetical protein